MVTTDETWKNMASHFCAEMFISDLINILCVFLLKLNYNYILKYKDLYWNLTIYFNTEFSY